MKTEPVKLTPTSPLLRPLGSALLAGLLTFVAGCLPVSLDPFYTEADLVAEPRLAGVWLNEDGTGTWTFDSPPSETAGYRLTLLEGEGERGTFAARTFRLNDQLFLDLSPTREVLESVKVNGLYGYLNVPGHTVLRANWVAAGLELALLDNKELAKILEANPRKYATRPYEGEGVLLTGTTRELQELLREVQRDEALWETIKLVRKAPEIDSAPPAK